MKTIKLSELENLIKKCSCQHDSMRPLMLITDDTSTYFGVKDTLLSIKDERRPYTLNRTDRELLGCIAVLSRDRIIVDWHGLASLEQIEKLVNFCATSSAQVIYLLSNEDLEYLKWLKDHPEENNEYNYDEGLLKNNFDMYSVVSSQDRDR